MAIKGVAKGLGFDCRHLKQVGSTQDYLRELVLKGEALAGTVVLAEGQSAGRGRFGHSWQSPSGLGLWMSLYLQPQLPLERAVEWQMRLSLSVCQALERVVPDLKVRLKWPNDWVCPEGKKLGGLLIENVVQGGKVQGSLVGIGLNILQQEFGEDLPWATSLVLMKAPLSVDHGVAQVRDEVLDALNWTLSPEEIQSSPKQGWLEDCTARLYGLGKVVVLEKDREQQPQEVLEAVLLGLDQNGRLQVAPLRSGVSPGRGVSVEPGSVQNLDHPQYRLRYGCVKNYPTTVHESR